MKYLLELVVILVVFVVLSVNQPVSLHAKQTYEMYEPYFVLWNDTCECHNFYDAIDIYRPDGSKWQTGHDSDNYVGDDTGNTTILPVDVPTKNLQLVYIRDDDSIAARLNFSVAGFYTITAPATVQLGEDITVSFTCSSWMGWDGFGLDDYIGLFPTGTSTLDHGYDNYYYVYQSCQNGKGTATIQGFDDSLPTLFVTYVIGADKSQNYSNTPIIQVVSGVTIKPSKSNFGTNDEIDVAYTAPATHSTDDRMYIYKGADYNVAGIDLQSQPIPSGTSGKITFDSISDDGTYSVVYKAGDVTVVANATFTIGGTGLTGLFGSSSVFVTPSYIPLLCCAVMLFYVL